MDGSNRGCNCYSTGIVAYWKNEKIVERVAQFIISVSAYRWFVSKLFVSFLFTIML